MDPQNNQQQVDISKQLLGVLEKINKSQSSISKNIKDQSKMFENVVSQMKEVETISNDTTESIKESNEALNEVFNERSFWPLFLLFIIY